MYVLFIIVKITLYVCHVNLKCAFMSLAALYYHVASAVGFKKEDEGRRGVLCMRYYPTCCHSDVGGVRARKACREIGEDEEGVGWGGEVLLKELYRETELIKLTNKRELFSSVEKKELCNRLHSFQQPALKPEIFVLICIAWKVFFVVEPKGIFFLLTPVWKETNISLSVL